MRIQGEKEALLEAAAAVLRVVAGRATLPVLGGIKITAEEKAVEFAGTDLEIFARVQGDFGVEEKGSTVVPGRLFGDILRSLPTGKVAISASEGTVRLEGGRSEFSLNSLPAADFPEVPQIPEAAVTKVAGGDLAKALRQVVRAASVDEARPVLTGVLWRVESGTLRLVATDSYRLAVREQVVKEGPPEAAAIVPGRALAEFGRHLAGVGEGEAEIRLGESQAEFSVGSTSVITRLIEGEFPNYKQLIPDGYVNRLRASREELLEAVGRIGLVAQANTPIKLHLGDEVSVSAVESGIGEGHEEITDATYTGSPMIVAFNPRFVADGLEAVDADRVNIEFGDPLKPSVLRGDGMSDYMYLVMPVRLPNS